VYATHCSSPKHATRLTHPLIEPTPWGDPSPAARRVPSLKNIPFYKARFWTFLRSKSTKTPTYDFDYHLKIHLKRKNTKKFLKNIFHHPKEKWSSKTMK
jgi:hypothetical protein